MDFYNVLITGEMGIKGAFSLIAFSGLKIFIIVGIILFIISIFDFYYQRYEFEESIKMTPSEAKQEMKEAEGDKSYLNRRRQMIREFIRKGMLQRVPKADVVVVNPTHYSVALQYEPSIHAAPIVVAKGEDELALIIRRLAKKHEVPIIEDRVQARLLYEEVEIDSEIPAKFFRAVSLIISRLDKFKKVA
jgi:flagellar biosynthesis protein FlhB